MYNYYLSHYGKLRIGMNRYSGYTKLTMLSLNISVLSGICTGSLARAPGGVMILYGIFLVHTFFYFRFSTAILASCG